MYATYFLYFHFYRHNMSRFRVIQCEVGNRLVSRLYKPGTMQKFLSDEELFDELMSSMWKRDMGEET